VEEGEQEEIWDYENAEVSGRREGDGKKREVVKELKEEIEERRRGQSEKRESAIS
jgi:hypothetical protein